MSRVQPGLYEKDGSGLMVPCRRVLAPTDQNFRGLPKGAQKLKPRRDVNNSQLEWMKDVATRHYERKTGRSLTLKREDRVKLKDFAKRAADEHVK